MNEIDRIGHQAMLNALDSREAYTMTTDHVDGMTARWTEREHPKSCMGHCATDALTGDHLCNCGIVEFHGDTAGLVQHDIKAILSALGIGAHARPQTPHVVVHDVILPAICAAKTAAHNAAVEAAAKQIELRANEMKHIDLFPVKHALLVEAAAIRALARPDC